MNTLNGSERRRHTRFAISASVNFQSESNFFSGETKNISEGGLYIECKEELPLGAMISIDLTFFGVHTVVSGEVMWVSRELSGSVEGFGVQFVDLEAKTKNSIEKFMRLRAPVELDLCEPEPEPESEPEPEPSRSPPGPPPLPSKRGSRAGQPSTDPRSSKLG